MGVGAKGMNELIHSLLILRGMACFYLSPTFALSRGGGGEVYNKVGIQAYKVGIKSL